MISNTGSFTRGALCSGSLVGSNAPEELCPPSSQLLWDHLREPSVCGLHQSRPFQEITWYQATQLLKRRATRTCGCVSVYPHCLNLGSKWMLKTLYPAWYWSLCVTEGDIWSYHTRQKDECDPWPHGTWSGDLRVSPFPLALFHACIYESHPFKCCPFTL